MDINDLILKYSKRAAACAVSAALIASSPGWGAYQAFAVVVSVPAKVSVPNVRVHVSNGGVSSAAGAGRSASLSPVSDLTLPSSVGPQAFQADISGVQNAAAVPTAATAVSENAGAAPSASVSRVADVRVADVKVPALALGKKTPMRSVMGRLSASVKALPRALKLGGASLKEAAGKDFDNGAVRFERVSGAAVLGREGAPGYAGKKRLRRFENGDGRAPERGAASVEMKLGETVSIDDRGGVGARRGKVAELNGFAAFAPLTFLAAPGWALPALGAAGVLAGLALYARSKSSWFAPAPGPANSKVSFAYRLQKKAASAAMMFAVAFPFLKPAQPGAPRMTPADRQALVDYYKEKNPKLVLMDWDNTFMDNRMGQNDKAGDQHYEIIRALRDAGIRVGFVTNRPFLGEGYGMEDLLMKGMPKDLASEFLLGVGGGAEVYEYGKNGEAPGAPTKKMSYITDEDRQAMKDAMREVGTSLGIDMSEGSSDFFDQNEKSYEYALILENHRDKIQALYDGFMAKMVQKGIAEKYKFQKKMPVNADLQPYVRVRVLGAVKANGVKGILEILKAQGEAIAPEDVLFFGDEFNPGNDDVSMARSLPTAAAIAVGETADPRVRNAYLTPGVGPESTLAFLWDMLGKTPRAGAKAYSEWMGRPYIGKEAWLSARYKPILQIGALAGFAAGVLAFATLFKATGGLAAVLLPVLTVAGTLVADRIARGSIESVFVEYEALLRRLPGVRGVQVSLDAKAIEIIFESEEARESYKSKVPSMINGYDVTTKAVGKDEPAAGTRDMADGSFLSAGILESFRVMSAAGLSPRSAGSYSVLLGAGDAAQAKGDSTLEDVLYFQATMRKVERFLDRLVKENSGWWARVTGKEQLIKLAARAFLQEIEQGRKPSFNLTTTEDGVKKVITLGGVSVSEALWILLKKDQGLSEADLTRFLEIARRTQAVRVGSTYGRVGRSGKNGLQVFEELNAKTQFRQEAAAGAAGRAWQTLFR